MGSMLVSASGLSVTTGCVVGGVREVMLKTGEDGGVIGLVGKVSTRLAVRMDTSEDGFRLGYRKGSLMRENVPLQVESAAVICAKSLLNEKSS